MSPSGLKFVNSSLVSKENFGPVVLKLGRESFAAQMVLSDSCRIASGSKGSGSVWFPKVFSISIFLPLVIASHN